MRLCSAMRSNASGRGARKPLVSARRGVLMALAMALHREDDCKEIRANSLVSYRALARCDLLPAPILEAVRAR